MKPLRKCTKCGKEGNTEEELDLFELNKECKYGRANRCKECATRKTRKYEKENPDKKKEHKRKWSIKFRYRVSEEFYDNVMESTPYCEICGSTDNLHFDHNHRLEGESSFRGVLCQKCNTALGLFQDSPLLLANALSYLEERGHYGE